MIRLVAGVDEAGRGPLAGPVYAAAVILDPARLVMGLADSKTLSAARRDTLALEIRAHALCWALGMATVEEIDRLNILQASLLAMTRAVAALSMAPSLALVDGKFVNLRVPYPIGFFTKWVEGRIDDPHAGWKGKSLWTTYSTRTMFHLEGGKENRPKAIKIQLRPDPLAR